MDPASSGADSHKFNIPDVRVPSPPDALDLSADSDTDADAGAPSPHDNGGNNCVARGVAIDHKVDLSEADTQLKERDRNELDEVEDLMEDEDDKGPVELLGNVTKEQKKRTVVADGKEVYKSSIARLISRGMPISASNTVYFVSKPKLSQDRPKKYQNIGRFQSRLSSDSTVIHRAFDYVNNATTYGIDLPEDSEKIKAGDYAAMIVNAKTKTNELNTLLQIL